MKGMGSRVHPAGDCLRQRRRPSGRALLAGGLFLFALASPPGWAHGGQYRAPTSPEPRGGIRSAVPSGLPSSPGVSTPAGYPSWRVWWSLNWERIVDIRVRMARAAPPGPPGAEGGWKALRPLSREEKKKLILPALEKAWRDRNPEVRAAAVIALGKLALPSTFPMIRKSLADRSRTVRNAAALALGLGGFREGEKDLLRVFRPGGAQNETRAWAAVGLGYLGTGGAVRALLAQLQSLSGKQVRGSNREVLICCAAGLTVCRSKDASRRIPSLLGKSGNRLPPARSLLYLALGKIGDRAGLPAVEEGLADKDPIVRAGAAAAAGLLGEKGDRSLLARLMTLGLNDPHYAVRALALVALGRIGGTAARAFLEERLSSSRKGVKLVFLEPFAALALGLAGDRGSVPALLPLLDTGAVDRKGAFALALGMLGGRRAASALARAVRGSRNPPSFSETALAAGMAGAVQARAFLQRVLVKEKRAFFRVAAAAALGLLGSRKEALDRVLGLLDQASSARLQAPLVFALTLLSDRKSIPRLASLLERRGVQDQVRALCCAALGNLGDSRRYPVLSEISRDFPWLVSTPALDEILLLF